MGMGELGYGVDTQGFNWGGLENSLVDAFKVSLEGYRADRSPENGSALVEVSHRVQEYKSDIGRGRLLENQELTHIFTRLSGISPEQQSDPEAIVGVFQDWDFSHSL